jgi:hypothetical protein
MVENSYWVEFFGAPGVGKSTLFNEVVKKMPKDWITENQAILNSKRILTTGKGVKSKLFKFLYTNAKIAKFLSKNHEPVNNRILLSNFIKEFSFFYNFSLDSIFNSNSTSYRKTTAFLQFLETVKRISLLRKSNLETNILSDESFCQRMFTQLSEEDIDEEIKVESYFNNLPFKGGIVYVKLNKKEIVARIKKRYKETNKINYMNVGLSSQELLNQTNRYVGYIKKGIEILEKKGVPILHIDNSLSVEFNSNEIVRFLKNKC